MELHNSTEDIIYWLLCLVFCGFQKNSAECKYSKSHWCPFPLREKKNTQNPKTQKPKNPNRHIQSSTQCIVVYAFNSPSKVTHRCVSNKLFLSQRGFSEESGWRKHKPSARGRNRWQIFAQTTGSAFSPFLPFPAQLWPSALGLDYSRNYKHQQHNKV